MKYKKCHNVGTAPKSNTKNATPSEQLQNPIKKIVERNKIDTSNTSAQDR